MSRRPARRLLLGGPVLVLALLAGAACAGPDAGAESGPAAVDRADPTTAFADCATLTAPLPDPSGPAGTSGRSGPAGAAGVGGEPGGRALPALTLPCFTGDTQVAVGVLRGPAVINLWASWCPPCRKELPAFQRLSGRAGERLRVIGVNTRDGRSAAQSIGEDLGLGFPTLFDPDQKLLAGLGGRAVLPITLFVDAEGRIRHRDETGALDDTELTALVREHLGVAVPS